MKGIHHIVVLLVLFSISEVSSAQPAYAYTPSNNVGNSIPFNNSSNLKQNLYFPADFSPAPSGLIQTLYIKSFSSTTANYNNLTIKMGSTTMSSFASGPYVTGLTTVFNSPISVTTAAGNWMVITLSTPYMYNNLQNLIIEFSQTGNSPGFTAICSGGSVAANRSLHGSAAATSGTSSARVVSVGFDFVTCPSPAAIQLNNITMTSADVHWDTAATSIGYEYHVSTNSVPPASGTATLDTFYNAQSLASGTQYYVHVRNNCGSSSFSSWISSPFTTVACPDPTGIQINNISRNGAIVQWDTAASSIGYEYNVSTNAAPPTSGTATLDTFYNAQSLTQGSQYYVHLRNNCGSSFSSWVTNSFTTDECMLATPNAANITDSSADVSWASVSGATNYEYSIDINSAPPATGTLTAAISVTASGLVDSTLYYAHVRSICNSDTSVWSTIDFTTFKKAIVGIDVKEIDELRITVYPNPMQHELTIDVKGNGSSTAQVTISDLNGRKVKKVRMQKGKITIDVNDLNSGVYFIMYQDQSHVKTIRVNRE